MAPGAAARAHSAATSETTSGVGNDSNVTWAWWATDATSRAAVAPVRENARLDEAAHRLSQGTDLRTALQFAGYHEVSSFSVSISNVPPSGDIERTIAQQFCQQIINPAFRDMGSWRSGTRVWIALAEPFTPPAHADLGEVSRRVLQLANEARAHPRRCGATPYAPAPPLAHRLRAACDDRAADCRGACATRAG